MDRTLKVRPCVPHRSVGELVQRNVGGEERPGPDDCCLFGGAGSIRLDVGDFESTFLNAAGHQAAGVVLRDVRGGAECHHRSVLCRASGIADERAK